MSTGVRKDCLFLLLIYSLVIDWIMEEVVSQSKGMQWTFTRQLEELNISLLSHSLNHIQEKTEKFSTIVNQVELKNNIKKTKSLCCSARNDTNIMLEDKTVANVENFTYLGGLVN